MIYVRDANGTSCSYRVYNKFAVYPNETWVTKPVPGKSVITLQSCTLPNYTQRLIVRAELIKTIKTHKTPEHRPAKNAA